MMARPIGGGADAAALERLAARGPVLVLAPHPDDESLGCGLLLDALWRGGGRAHVACLTDGAASHPRSRAWPPARLAAERRRELERAVGLLGGDPARDLTWLGHPDAASHLLHGPGADLARDVAALVDRLGAGTIVAPSPLDPHCDHEAGARAAERVQQMRPGLALWFYPIWSRWLGALAGEPAPAAEIALGRFDRRGVKRAAIAAHRSQRGLVVADDPAGFSMPPGFERHFETAPELFYGAAS